jgi:hypothetical protein
MKDYRPISVISFIVVMAMAGLFFFYPAENSDKPSNPISKVESK